MENIANILDMLEQRDKAYRRKKSLDNAYIPCGVIFILASITAEPQMVNLVGYGVAIAMVICTTAAQHYQDKIKKIDRELPDHINDFVWGSNTSQTAPKQGSTLSI